MKLICSNMEQLRMLYEEKAKEANKKYEAVLECRQVLRDRFLQLKQRRLDLEMKYIACAELHGNVKVDGNDIIKLNVGGVGVMVKRSVLTQFPHSKLAVLFSGRWDKKLLRDKKNRFFLDVDPVCFQIILDYLTQCSESPGDAPLPSMPEVSEDLKATFDCLCTFFNIVFSGDTYTSAPANVEKSKHIKTCGSVGESVEDSCDALKAVLKEERSILDSMEQALSEEESSFLGEEMFVTSFAGGETKDIVQLNVSGGEVMSVRRSTLRLCEGSVLYHQFDDTAWCQGNKRERESEAGIDSDSDDDDDAGMLIDQPLYAFGKLINQLRLIAIMLPGMKVPRPYIEEQEMTNFEAVVQYYFPGQEEFMLGKMVLFTSDDILVEEDHKLLLEGWVAESKPDLVTEVTLSLLYRGSRDGFGAADFHAKCDDKDATVTIVKSTEGYIFGGFSDQSWDGGCWKASSRAFLFSIVNPAGLAPMKLPLTGEWNKCAIGCSFACGPVFGSGSDLCIRDNCNTVKESYSYLRGSYTLPPGQNKMTFLAGSEFFLVAEIEVFAVQQQQEE
jgi:hypothetical protein